MARSSCSRRMIYRSTTHSHNGHDERERGRVSFCSPDRGRGCECVWPLHLPRDVDERVLDIGAVQCAGLDEAPPQRQRQLATLTQRHHYTTHKHSTTHKHLRPKPTRCPLLCSIMQSLIWRPLFTPVGPVGLIADQHNGRVARHVAQDALLHSGRGHPLEAPKRSETGQAKGAGCAHGQKGMGRGLCDSREGGDNFTGHKVSTTGQQHNSTPTA